MKISNKAYLGFAVLAVVFILVFRGFMNTKHLQEKEEYGTVIILNGPSAAGKTSIQKKVQELFKVPYLRVGIDDFFNDVLPDEHARDGVNPKYLDVKSLRYVEFIEVDGKKAVKLIVGPEGMKAVKGMHYAIAAYAKAGNNVIVDYINYEKGWLDELLSALDGAPTYLIKVDISLPTLEKREFARSSSPVGHSRSHYFNVYGDYKYDLTVSSENNSPEEIALEIRKLVYGE